MITIYEMNGHARKIGWAYEYEKCSFMSKKIIKANFEED